MSQRSVVAIGLVALAMLAGAISARATASSPGGGSHGQVGPTGHVGVHGWQGITGAQGAVGVRGRAGLRGALGPSGAVGPSGRAAHDCSVLAADMRTSAADTAAVATDIQNVNIYLAAGLDATAGWNTVAIDTVPVIADYKAHVSDARRIGAPRSYITATNTMIRGDQEEVSGLNVQNLSEAQAGLTVEQHGLNQLTAAEPAVQSFCGS